MIQSLSSLLPPQIDLELQEDIDFLIKLCKTRKLSLNYQKFTVSFCFYQMNHSLYMLEASQIPEVNCHRDLGVLVSSDLSCADHYKYVCKNAYGIFNMVRRSIPFSSPITTKKLLYTSLVRSKLSYYFSCGISTKLSILSNWRMCSEE